MKQLLSDDKYNFVSQKDKDFIVAFDEAMVKIGCESGGIVPYVVWGKYMIAYSRAGIKTKNYVGRFYFRDDSVLFRLYFRKIDKHCDYIEQAPDFIKSSFTNEIGNCSHCDNNCKDDSGNCSHRKTYTLDGRTYEKCDGMVFYFENHDVDNVPKYIELLTTFYPRRRKVGKT